MPNPNLSFDRKLDQICSEFEDAWSARSRQDFERYLNQVEPNHRDDLLRALVEMDIELRLRDRQTISIDDYVQFGASILGFVERRIATSGQQAPFETIQRICNEFRNELSEGKSPTVSDFAKRVDERSRVALIRNLLHIDIDHRRRAGEVTHTVDYTRDMPEHSSLISSTRKQGAACAGR